MAVKPDREDPFAHHVKWEIDSTLGFDVGSVRTVAVYTIFSNLSQEQLFSFARDVLCDPILTIFSVGSPVAVHLKPFSWALEVSYKPGVTDNVGRTAAEALIMMTELSGECKCRVYKSTQYLIKAGLCMEDVEKIGNKVLFNDLIEDIAILSHGDFIEQGGFAVKEMNIGSDSDPETEIVDLDIPDDDLLNLSEKRVLALTLEELKYFRSYYSRDDVRARRRAVGISERPTDVELEVFAQTQSEHCKHKIFNARITYREFGRSVTIQSLFKTYIQAATREIAREKDWLVSVFRDNAGVIRFNDEYNLAFKVETHNTPSALDPYGGAITGVVGCDRDPAGTGIGSRIIAHTDVLCFGDPNFTGELPPRMMHPKRIMEGVIKGIEDGGNKCGIPTINGGLIFDRSYSGKPLVFCGAVGIMPALILGQASHEKGAEPGDAIVMVGGRIGKDGIHGATFSSEEIKESSPVQAVQIGDPITQKKMLDMLIEARDMLLYRGITDNGAGGLSSSVGEMALLSGGAFLELEHAPLKYPGLRPWEILLSEAQERMTLAVPRENLSTLLSLARRRDVLAVPIGEFTDSGYLQVHYRGKPVCFLDLAFLHSNIPLELEAEWESEEIAEIPPQPGRPFSDIILDMVSDLNSCSREPLIRRYDHEVGGGTVLKPQLLRPSDAAVIAPVPGEMRGFVLAAGINPFYSAVDTYHMAACCVDEALRNAVVTGADPGRIALLDNFCWPDPVYDRKKTPDGRLKLAQLVRAAKGLYETAVVFRAPFISGKDSMKNDYKIKNHKISVLPTVLVSAVGVVPDIRCCVTSDFKFAGDTVYLLGKTGNHLGQSLYFRIYGGSSSTVPTVDPEHNMKLYRRYFEAAKRGLIASGHDLSEGGLGVALAESCIAGNRGADVDLRLMPESSILSDEKLFFSESTGRILVSVNPECEHQFRSIMKDVQAVKIGTVVSDKRLRVKGKDGKETLSVGIGALIKSYRTPLFSVLGMKP
jgi:phosphoribosylformylglycinamidine synthase